jgi:hypothetical protein
MEALVDGHPGPNETWEELAEHSLLRDDVDPATWAPVQPAAGENGQEDQ